MFLKIVQPHHRSTRIRSNIWTYTLRALKKVPLHKTWKQWILLKSWTTAGLPKRFKSWTLWIKKKLSIWKIQFAKAKFNVNLLPNSLKLPTCMSSRKKSLPLLTIFTRAERILVLKWVLALGKRWFSWLSRSMAWRCTLKKPSIWLSPLRTDILAMWLEMGFRLRHWSNWAWLAFYWRQKSTSTNSPPSTIWSRQ